VSCLFSSGAFFLIPFIYARLVESASQGLEYSNQMAVYIILLFSAFVFIKTWSFANNFFQAKSFSFFYNKLLMSSLHSKNKDITVFSKDLDFASQLFLDFVYTVPAEALVFLAMLVVMFFLEPLVFAIVLLGVFLFVLLMMIKDKRIIPFYYKAQELYYKMYNNADALLKNRTDIFTNQAAEWAKTNLEKHVTSYVSQKKHYETKNSAIEILIKSSASITYLASILIILWQLSDGRITIGRAVLIVQFAGFIKSYIASLYQEINYLLNFKSHLNRINDRLCEQAEKISNGEYAENNGGIVLEASGLSYSYGDAPIFSNLSFNLKKSEILGISGASGVGKSTLIAILCNMLKKQGGSIILQNGIKICYLTQESFIFNRSVRENMFVAKESLSDDEMLKLSHFYGLDEYFLSIKKDLTVSLGENGKNISGGQRSQFELLRTLACDADIIILDEPLTGVDADKRLAIMKNFKAHLGERSCIMASHQSDILDFADRVLKMNGKEIASNEK
jgi:ABC-type bacteriocin/lantibiotic exporter with double-glycine peptidase domain